MTKRLHLLLFLSAACVAPLLTLPMLLTRSAAGEDSGPFVTHLPLLINGGAVALESVVAFVDGDNVYDIAHAGDERVFVAFEDGRVYTVGADGRLADEPFLDITSKVQSSWFEQGLLGLTFHPDFATNGYFYVYYSARAANYNDIAGVLARYTVPPGGIAADPASEQIVLTIPKVPLYHYGGSIQFGPDGYLYVAVGDGKFFDYNETPPSPPNSQNGANLMGKILRLDVDDAASGGGLPYAIPPDNPYVDDESTLDEIWMMGLRNPWRISFDRLTGELYIADVGLGREEEINIVPAGVGGLNFGWPCYEGNQVAFAGVCDPETDYEFPVYTYEHTLGRCAITGGYVYRGQTMPWLAGHYLFSDFCTGELMALERVGPTTRITDLAVGSGHVWVTFGEDVAGELYLGEWRDDTAQGPTALYRIVPAP